MSKAIITAICNSKGGSGKTTNAVNLAMGLSERGVKTLIVDIDPQHSATNMLGVRHKEGDYGIHSILFDKVDPANAVKKTAYTNLDIIASADIMMAAAQQLSADVMGVSSCRLYQAFKKSSVLDDYQVILIDCPGARDILVANALNLAHDAIIPCQPDTENINGVSLTYQAIQESADYGIGNDVALDGVLICGYKKGTATATETLEGLRAALPEGSLYETIISETLLVPSSYKEEKPIIDFRPKSSAAEEYRALANEYMIRHEID